MGRVAALLLLITSITSICLAVTSVAVSWRAASRCTRALKQLRARLSMPPSDARLAKVETDQAELFSILGKLTTTTKRLSSRAGMQDVRERQQNSPPPLGATKAQLRQHYGIVGLSGPEQARRQLQMNLPTENANE